MRPQPSTLEIEQIVLVDRRGRKRIRLVGDDGGPAITLFDGSGKKRLELRIGDEAPTVALLDAKENELATIRLVGDQASLLMGGRQRDQEPSVSLESGPQRKPGLYLRDHTGAPVASLTNEGNSEASLRLESGKRGTSVRPDGLFVQDSRGLNRAVLALLNGNFPVIGLNSLDQLGPPSIEMTAGDDGARRLAVHNQGGFPLFSVYTSEKGATYLDMRQPDHLRSLQISLGPKDQDGPTIACFAAESPGQRGTVLPKLQLGLRPDCKPFVRMSDGAGKSVFTAP
jgi:hypothetical protein